MIETGVTWNESETYADPVTGTTVTRPFTSIPDHRLRLIRLPLDGSGRPEILYEHEPAQSAHCAYNPRNGNILYFDLDLPPGYWRGGDGKTPRIWLCDIATRSSFLAEEGPRRQGIGALQIRGVIREMEGANPLPPQRPGEELRLILPAIVDGQRPQQSPS